MRQHTQSTAPNLSEQTLLTLPRGLDLSRASDMKRKIRQIGTWAGVRWLRNQGVEFEHAYYVMFGRLPRR